MPEVRNPEQPKQTAPDGDGQAPATSAPPRNGSGAPEAAEEPKRRNARPILFSILAVVVVIGAVLGVRYWRFASTHVGTDDAQLTADVIQISPQVSGTVTRVYVSDNQEVKQGQLLVTLDDATYRANVDQAQANLDAAIASAKGAGVSVALTSETGVAQETQAQGVVQQAQSAIAGAQADVARAQATVATAVATAGGAQANIGNAQAAINAAIANKQRAQDAVGSAQAQLDAAHSAVSAAQAAADAAKAVADRQSRDAARYAGLVKQGAVSEQTADQATSGASAAQAQYQAAHQQVMQAQAVVAQRQADVNAARQQLNASDAAIAQARAGLKVAQQQSAAAQAGINQAQAARNAAQQSVSAAEARRQQAAGQLNQARTTPRQVAVSQSAQAQATAKIEQAKAALDLAKTQLGYTRIYAPVAGRVSKKTVEVGALVQPGTPLMALVPAERIWVVANFKETQLAGVTPGQPAEIEVDALPGKAFRGKVDSIAAATGATFALLPPDNATGNFTKVVQRVPVKITIDPGQRDYDRLRAGMSVTATIETR